MTISEQANLVVGALQDWAKTNLGRAFIAADVLDCIERLRSKPGMPSAAVLWTGEDPHGEFADDTGMQQRKFKVVISRGRSLKVQPGESLTEGAAGGAGMFDLAEQAREIVRALRMQDMQGEMQLPVYLGTGQFEAHGYLLDAMEVRFGLFGQIPRQQEVLNG